MKLDQNAEDAEKQWFAHLDANRFRTVSHAQPAEAIMAANLNAKPENAGWNDQIPENQWDAYLSDCPETPNPEATA